MKTTNKENQTSSQTLAGACLDSCRKLVAQVERAKKNLKAEFRQTFAAHEQLLAHVINQADALAWQTEYPHLLFPTLALEKVQSAVRWQERQRLILKNSPAYPLAA